MEKRSLVLGIIGALIGGIIATIPWILVYVFGNMMFSALAIIIAFISLKGYELLKGPETKKLPLIITIISIFSVSLATLVIIPLVMLYKEGYEVSFHNLKLLYGLPDFIAAIAKDFVIAIIFTFLGISGIIKNLKQANILKQQSEEIKTEEQK